MSKKYDENKKEFFIFRIIKWIWNIIREVIDFITDFFKEIIELVLFVIVALFLLSFITPYGGFTGLAFTNDIINYGKSTYYDAKDFIMSNTNNQISEECRTRIYNLTPDTLEFENSITEKTFEFEWNDGTYTKFKQGFKLEKGNKKNQNINYYYPNREFEYSKKVTDSTGTILGEDKFRADLTFRLKETNMILDFGTMTFDVVNITPTYCNFYKTNKDS